MIYRHPTSPAWRSRWILWITLVSLASQHTVADVLLSDSFDFQNGALTETGVGRWRTLTGTAARIQTRGGALHLQEGEFEIVESPLTGAPYATGKFYAGFTIVVTALPSGTGGDFAAFSAAEGPRTLGRVFVTTQGAASGTFRVGVSTALHFPTATVPKNLSLNTSYRVVVQLELPFLGARAWVDAESEDVQAASSGDSTFPGTLAGFAFRQRLLDGNGMGTLEVDDVVVATRFDEVKSAPSHGPSKPVIESPRWLDGTFSVRSPTRTGMSYTFERKSSVSDTQWIAVEQKPGTGEVVEFLDPDAAGARALYRLRVE